MKRTREQLVAHLKKENLVFSDFTLVHEGNYSTTDADWNYKDVPHLHWVHELVESTIGYVDDDKVATINLQQVAGFTMPMALFNYQSSPTTQTYFTSLLFFALIIETSYQALEPNRTRVSTTYSIGSSKFWRWVHPIIQWTIKRNYENLMSQDIPMRTRRGQLRSWGYSFKNPAPTPMYSFEQTMDVSKSNVVLPNTPLPFDTQRVSLTADFNKDGERWIGRDDHLGLRLVRAGSKLAIYPRLCPHEGSSLDSKPCVNGRVQCHWHGRLFGPLVSIDLSNTQKQELDLEYHVIRLEEAVLTIQAKNRQSVSAGSVQPSTSAC